MVMTVDEVGVENHQRALDCYITYQQTIEEAGIRRDIPPKAVFEICREACDPLMGSLLDGLPKVTRGNQIPHTSG